VWTLPKDIRGFLFHSFLQGIAIRTVFDLVGLGMMISPCLRPGYRSARRCIDVETVRLVASRGVLLVLGGIRTYYAARAALGCFCDD